MGQVQLLDQHRMRPFAVMDQMRFRLDVGSQGCPRAFPGRLGSVLRNQNNMPAFIAGRSHAQLVPGYPPVFLAVFPALLLGLGNSKECLVQVDPAFKNHVLLGFPEHCKYLGKPVSACGICIPVVPGACGDRMEFKQVDQVLDPFGDRYFPVLEYRPRQRGERPAAVIAEEAPYAVPVFPVRDDPVGSAVPAGADLNGIYQRHFLCRHGPVFCIVPLADSGTDHLPGHGVFLRFVPWKALQRASPRGSVVLIFTHSLAVGSFRNELTDRQALALIHS